MSQSNNVEMVVKWFVPEKQTIKFEDMDNPVEISDNVMSVSDFSKYPIKAGDKVTVAIENDTVTYMRKINTKKAYTKKTETKTTSQDVETKTLTVEAVFEDKSIKFLNEKINGKKWCELAEELLDKGAKKLGLVAKAEVQVQIANGKIVDVVAVEEQNTTNKEDENTKTTDSVKATKRTSSYRDEDSMDRRTAVMCAKDVITAMINNKCDEVKNITLIEAGIKKLSDVFYKTTQQL